jgi:hypothetical protein
VLNAEFGRFGRLSQLVNEFVHDLVEFRPGAILTYLPVILGKVCEKAVCSTVDGVEKSEYK